MNENSVAPLEILEASLPRLVELSIEMGDLPPEIEIYRQVLELYLRHDAVALRELIDDFARLMDAEPVQNLILKLAQVRLQVRVGILQKELLMELESCVVDDPAWRGEKHFVLALAYGKLGEFAAELKNYREASHFFEKAGLKQKSLKAYHNMIATMGSLEPNRSRALEYHTLYRKARRLQDHAVCGLALFNISRELQTMRALRAALQYVNRSLQHFANDWGNLNYYLALTHRAHLLLQMGRDQEAEMDLEMASTGKFPEVQGAIELIRSWREKRPAQVESKTLEPSWQARMRDPAAEMKASDLSEMEEKLLQYLATGPKEKGEVLDYLYGDRIDTSARENRLKNLLFRLRKRDAQMIRTEQGRLVLNASEAMIIKK